MSDFLDEVRGDCLEAETDLGSHEMRWNGTDYPVAATLTRRGSVLVVGGREVDIKLTLRVRYEGLSGEWEFDSASLPKVNQTVTYRDTTYKIAQVNNAHSTFLEIDLMDANR